jgi:hypothetical protein
MTDIRTQVNQALAVLGNEPDAVADALRAKGIKGAKGSDSDDPIARYLVAQLPGVALVEVYENRIEVTTETGQMADRIGTPDAIALFVRRFDRGVYLDLVDQGGDVQ